MFPFLCLTYEYYNKLYFFSTKTLKKLHKLAKKNFQGLCNHVTSQKRYDNSMVFFLDKSMILERKNNFKSALPELLSKIKDMSAYKKLKTGTEQKAFIKSILSEDALVQLNTNSQGTPTPKNTREILLHFFGMNENWKLGRNLLGGLMVHSPEYPTYFIPAYTQAKATGDAKELKKGEGPRGLITGGLEGVAVGALVSGEMLKPKEMIPYIILGAALQFFSSKFFPWIAEKLGKMQYDKANAKQELQKKSLNLTENTVENPLRQSMPAPKFNGKPSPYRNISGVSLKI